MRNIEILTNSGRFVKPFFIKHTKKYLINVLWNGGGGGWGLPIRVQIIMKNTISKHRTNLGLFTSQLSQEPE